MEASQAPIIVLAGPTASGKTDVAIALARRVDAEIVSADSRQVYRGLDIGTAKPDAAQLAAVRHHGIDICDPSDIYTAGRFHRDAGNWMRDIRARGRRVLIVGGSGLYIRTLTDGLFDGPEADAALRAGLERTMAEQGLGALVEQLRARDPVAAASIDTRNPVRVIRALEVCLLTGRPYSSLRVERMPVVPQDVRFFGLRRERAALHERIDRRVDAMVEAGLEDEVRRLLDCGADPSWISLNTVGYTEMIAYLSSSTSFVECVDAIKLRTRQYARRQMTWFRKEQRMGWIDVDDSMSEEEMAAVILDACRDGEME
jgi:tRNA dimethylallyltransferase